SASWPRWVRCPWHARPTVAHLPWFHHPELELVASRAEGPYLINRQSPNPIAFGCQFRHPGLVARTFHFGNRLPHTCRSWAGNYRERERPPDPAEGSDSQTLPYVTLPSSTRRAPLLLTCLHHDRPVRVRDRYVASPPDEALGCLGGGVRGLLGSGRQLVLASLLGRLSVCHDPPSHRRRPSCRPQGC